MILVGRRANEIACLLTALHRLFVSSAGGIQLLIVHWRWVERGPSVSSPYRWGRPIQSSIFTSLRHIKSSQPCATTLHTLSTHRSVSLQTNLSISNMPNPGTNDQAQSNDAADHSQLQRVSSRGKEGEWFSRTVNLTFRLGGEREGCEEGR